MMFSQEAGGLCLKQEDGFEDLIEPHFKNKKIKLKQDSTVTDFGEATSCRDSSDDNEMMLYPRFVDLVEERSNRTRLIERESER